jgi:hypothetical protein
MQKFGKLVMYCFGVAVYRRFAGLLEAMVVRVITGASPRKAAG